LVILNIRLQHGSRFFGVKKVHQRPPVAGAPARK
jgi:hypothetical protein